MGWDAASTLLTLTYLLGVGVFLCCILACVPAVHAYRHQRDEALDSSPDSVSDG
tara:strand:+ start:2110 stop:2271 length:162 start_codon:yes stop_codon:yes gene_type:complete